MNAFWSYTAKKVVWKNAEKKGNKSKTVEKNYWQDE
jgi:hypothetical protein